MLIFFYIDLLLFLITLFKNTVLITAKYYINTIFCNCIEVALLLILS